MNPICIGLSGYSYKPWQGKGRFYPEKLKSAEFLRYYAGRFNTVELDGMWYRLPTEQTVQGWLEQTPSSFIFSPKAHRQITHMHRLRPDALLFVKTMLDRLAPLIRQKRLGPILLQLPPNFMRDDDRLNKFLEQASRTARWAIEFRHDSWHAPEVEELLRHHGVSWVAAERMRLQLRSAIPPNSGMCACDGVNTLRQRSQNGLHDSLIWLSTGKIVLSTASMRMKDRHGYGRTAFSNSLNDNTLPPIPHPSLLATMPTAVTAPV